MKAGNENQDESGENAASDRPAAPARSTRDENGASQRLKAVQRYRPGRHRKNAMGHAMVPEAFIEGAALAAPVGEKPKPVSSIEGNTQQVEQELDTGIS